MNYLSILQVTKMPSLYTVVIYVEVSGTILVSSRF